MRHELTAAALSGVLAWAGASAAETPNRTRGQVQIRVYDAGVTSAIDLDTALAAATGALSSAGIETTWLVCGPTSSDRPGCNVPVAHDELAVRLVRGAGGLSAQGTLSLGNSLVDTSIAIGTLATVYVNRVQVLAAQARCVPHHGIRDGRDPLAAVVCDSATLLGLAVAHEVGHLLLGTGAHGATGLMRAVWSQREIQHHDPADWLFTTDESLAMERALRARHLQATARVALSADTRLESSDVRMAH